MREFFSHISAFPAESYCLLREQKPEARAREGREW